MSLEQKYKYQTKYLKIILDQVTSRKVEGTTGSISGTMSGRDVGDHGPPLPSITCNVHDLLCFSPQPCSDAVQIREPLFSMVPLSFDIYCEVTLLQTIFLDNIAQKSQLFLIADRRNLFLTILLNTSSLEI